ncbi:MAG: hypothetical protein ACI906_000924 [Candidatus Latescibacterota bacterium]|jgi:hypothetical protein
MHLGHTKNRCLPLFALLVALCPLSLWALDGIEVSISGIVGVNNVTVGNEILIYYIEVRDIINGNRTARIGGVPVVSEGINIAISDLTAATGIVPGDFTGLNLYRSTDAVLDVGDTFLKAVAPVNIGADITVDFTAVANPNRILPEPAAVPDHIFFLISANIAPGATPGHSFRLGAAANHVDIRDSGGGPPADYLIGSAIVAADGNRVVIGAAGGGGGGDGDGGGDGGGSVIDFAAARADSTKIVKEVVEIPFGSEWLFALGGLLYGVYALYRRN